MPMLITVKPAGRNSEVEVHPYWTDRYMGE
jgi:hypothetical protein